jgi:hypothetical protein
MPLLDALRLGAHDIATKIARSNLFTNTGDIGEFREQVIQQFLRPFLPPCYGLSPGEIFSADGQQSAQVDIVIYDAVFSTVLFRDGTRMLFPAESVYGSIEVKSNLSLAELDKACGNISSIKRLPRQRADAMDLLPFLRFSLGPGLQGGGDFRNPYLGVVFGYKGANVESALNALTNRIATVEEDRQWLPDFVFVGDPGYMIYRRRQDSTPAPPGVDFATFGWIPTGPDTLPMLFLTLATYLGHFRLRWPDLSAMWVQVLRDSCERHGWVVT